MARQERDREDLLAEATALVRRVELSVDGFDEPVVVGFRSEGCASFYFGPDPALHFNSRGHLRRAFLDGDLWKAERGRLVRLRRQRADGQVQLLRSELAAEPLARLLGPIEALLRQLQQAIAAGGCSVLRQVPQGADLLAEIESTVLKSLLPLRVAASPRAG